MVLKKQIYTTEDQTLLQFVRRDSLPEGLINRGFYSDDGCAVITTCLGCPLSSCLEDISEFNVQREIRDKDIVKMRSQGVAVQEIAVQKNVSTRTVHRVVQAGGVKSQ